MKGKLSGIEAGDLVGRARRREGSSVEKPGVSVNLEIRRQRVARVDLYVKNEHCKIPGHIAWLQVTRVLDVNKGSDKPKDEKDENGPAVMFSVDNVEFRLTILIGARYCFVVRLFVEPQKRNQTIVSVSKRG